MENMEQKEWILYLTRLLTIIVKWSIYEMLHSINIIRNFVTSKYTFQ